MSNMKSLAKDTAIYGVSSIIGRFLNYLLVPLYTVTFTAASGGYGVVTNVYSWTALLFVLLTCGMETGFFRFANKSDENPRKVFSTILISVLTISLVFLLLAFLFIQPVSSFLGYEAHPEYIGMMLVVVAIDAFLSIPFAYLRQQKRPIKFASIKLFFVFSNIILNLFFLIICPVLYRNYPEMMSWYDPDYGVGYVFIANLITTILQIFFFIPELKGFSAGFDAALLKRIFCYSFPILILGVVGILNQTIDKILFPFLLDNTDFAKSQLGIYGAASKIAMILAMCTQAFRYAYEPFVFGKNKEGDNRSTYAQAMKFFIIFALLAFLGVMFYLDLIKYLIAPDYWPGLQVVPIVMVAEIFMGIYFNLSFWYKLIDQTKWGAWFSLIGCTIIIFLNVYFVPVYGYVACAWAGLAGYLVITLLSYFVGQKKYPIKYDIKGITVYIILAGILYTTSELVIIDNLVLKLIFRTLLLLVFIGYLLKKDLPLDRIPVINRFKNKPK